MIRSVKLFCDEVISGISLSLLGDDNFDDKENLGAFRKVVKLLTGELLGNDDILDPHMEVVPVVSDILRPRPSKNIIVKRLADYFLKDELEILRRYANKINKNNRNINSSVNYPASSVETGIMNIPDLASGYIGASEQIIDVNGTLYQIQTESPSVGDAFYDQATTAYDPFQQCFQPTTLLNPPSQGTFLSPFDINNLMPATRCSESPGKLKYNTTGTPNKRGRKAHK